MPKQPLKLTNIRPNKEIKGLCDFCKNKIKKGSGYEYANTIVRGKFHYLCFKNRNEKINDY